MIIQLDDEIKIKFIDLVRLCEDAWNYSQGTKNMATFVFNYLCDIGVLEE